MMQVFNALHVMCAVSKQLDGIDTIKLTTMQILI